MNYQTNSFDIAGRPNIAPGASAAGPQAITPWFNKPVLSQAPPFPFGNLSLTVPNVAVQEEAADGAHL